MAKNDSEDTSIELSSNEAGLPAIKISGLTKTLRWLMPGTYRKNLMAEALSSKIAASGEFTDDEKALMTWAANGQQLKFENQAKVAKYIFECEPELLEAAKTPLALPPKPEEVVDRQLNDQFWDRFWADAENASADYVQHLYGKIGARKARDPKAISLRTLDAIRCVEPEQAHFLDVLSDYLFDDGIAPANASFALEYTRVGLTVPWLSDLEAGAFIDRTETTYTVAPPEYLTLNNGIHVRAIDGAGNPCEISLPIMIVTRVGRELMSLRKKEPSLGMVTPLLFYFGQFGDRIEWRRDETSDWSRYDPDGPTPTPGPHHG